MKTWLAVVAGLVLGVLAMASSNTTFAKRRHARELIAEVHAPDRFVDVSVRLATVVADPDGEELIPGKPRLRIVRARTFGGVLDTKLATPRLVAPPRAPEIWYCSEDQEPVILHADADPLGQVVYGSEGAGKTTALVQWLYLRWLEHLGTRCEIGVTAPTNVRLGLVLHELQGLWPARWHSLRVADNILELIDGSRVRLVSTYRQSAAQGSRIQGFSWVACGRDEMQDSIDVHEDIESRGRDAPHGRYKQLGTCTAKDSADWRTLRDKLDAARDERGAPLWIRRTLYGRRSPFVAPSFWAAKAASMSSREFSRRVEAKDVGPERAVYPAWSREHNLITVPDLGWEDVTAYELRKFGANLTLLAGHDPGNLFDVTLLLKAYRMHAKQQRPIWVVRGELTTEQSTTEIHIVKLLELLRERWRVNLLAPDGTPNPDGNRVLVICDPAGNNDNRTDRTVYTQFRGRGIEIRPAAYAEGGTGHGRVPREPAIEVVNTLLCDAAGERRLFVERLADGSPAAPRLVASIESSERDLAGKAEAQRKGPADQSHWPAALRYPLWPIEKPRLDRLRDGGRS